MLSQETDVTFAFSGEWTIGGSHPQEYDLVDPFETQKIFDQNIEENAQDDLKFTRSVASIRSIVAVTHGYGTLLQTLHADQLNKKRIKLKGFLKAENLRGWAGLWLRISGIEESSTRFDNLQNHNAIEGDWRECECVIELPDASELIEPDCELSFGAMLNGSGQLWITGVTLELLD